MDTLEKDQDVHDFTKDDAEIDYTSERWYVTLYRRLRNGTVVLIRVAGGVTIGVIVGLLIARAYPSTNI